jgi:hypothetical protein
MKAASVLQIGDKADALGRKESVGWSYSGLERAKAHLRTHLCRASFKMRH